MDLTKTLSMNPVFRGVPATTVSFLAALAEVRTYQGGDILMRQYERADSIIVILEGEVVTKTIQEDILGSFGPGSIVGEMSLLDGGARSATVVAKGRTKVAIFEADYIRSAMESDPEAGRAILGNLARLLCGRIRSMNATLELKPPSRMPALI